MSGGLISVLVKAYSGKDEDLERAKKMINDIEIGSPIDSGYVDSFPYDDAFTFPDDDDCVTSTEVPSYYDILDRMYDVVRFTDRYKFEYGQKVCVHPSGLPIVTHSDKCLESTWVGVRGMHSVCVVISRDMDMTRLPAGYHEAKLKNHNMGLFANTAISEVECLPYEDVNYCDNAFRRLCTGTLMKRQPFSVVSRCRGPLEQSPPSWVAGRKVAEPVQGAISFLDSVMKSDLLHTHYGIIRVALKAYQLMCPRKLSADDIWVTIMNFEFGQFDHLPMDIISEQLDFVNAHSELDFLVNNSLSSEEDTQKPLFKFRGLLLKD